jgi:hypothetical protein
MEDFQLRRISVEAWGWIWSPNWWDCLGKTWNDTERKWKMINVKCILK